MANTKLGPLHILRDPLAPNDVIKFDMMDGRQQAGVLTPVALWAEVGGMPESPVLAEHSDRYFDLRLRAAQQQ
eukprot:3247379-Amphidinium_carterae.2